jgi:hypothetical protein
MPNETPSVAAQAVATQTTAPPTATPAKPAETKVEPPKGAPAAGAKPNGEAKPGGEPAKDPKAGGEKPPPTSKAWADLSAKERAVAARDADVKKRETELAAKEAALLEGGTKTERERIKKLIAEKRFDDLEKEFGFDYREWTKARLAKGGAKPAQQPGEAPLTAEGVAKLVAEGIAKDRETRQSEESKAQEERASKHWEKTMSDVATLVKGAGDKYSSIGMELEHRAPWLQETLQEMATLDPTINVDVALDKLEGWLLQKTVNHVKSSPKLMALLGLGPANPATGEQPKNEQNRSAPRERSGSEANEGGPRTLTNVLAADGAPNGAAPANRPLSKAAKVMAEREAKEADVRRIAAKLSE